METFTHGQAIAESSFLGEHRSARGEEGGCTVAEPSGPQPDVLLLGHGELGT
jgi:hypothetical protein